MTRLRPVLLLAGWAALAFLVVVSALDRLPCRGWDGPAVVVQVDAGQSTRTIAENLARAGVVRSPFLLALRARLTGQAGRLRAGEYRFDRPVTPADVLDTLTRGRVVLYPVTVPEGLTLEETASRLATSGVATAEDLLAAFRDPRPILDLDPGAPDLEGYLFPDTYAFPRRVAAPEVVQAMLRRFRQVLGEIGWKETGPPDIDLRGLVSLASLVEKETAVADERALVAGVFTGRLTRGWRLECDPTVVYALKRDGRYVTGRPLRRSELAYDSPYNTYLVSGLPPGPICSPGQGALEAALSPAATRALYFVSRGDGSGRHEFSATLREHQAAVARYRSRSRTP
jgi:UPF0755 protein